ncbi:MAG: GIY-YIG nuclease family protein [Candidatus Margulisiibacteriota bacterium]
MKKNCVYILESKKDGRFYVGQTDDLVERLSAHNRGSVKSTKCRKPLELIFYKTYNTRSEAVREEARIKNYKNTEKLLMNMALSSNG